AVREDQIRDADGGEDHEAAHRRRARLELVLGRTLLPDLLPELLLAQVLDELRPEEDRDEERGEPRDQDLAHQPARSVLATNSSPTAREPLTSTTSRSRIASRTISAASEASDARRTSPAS